MKKNNKYLPFLFMLPAIILIVFIYIGPMIFNLGMSFTDWNGISKNFNFIGLKNYLDILKASNTQVLLPLKNTFIFASISVFCQNIIAFMLAVFLNEKFKGRDFFRTVFFVPTIITIVAVGFMWQLIFDPLRGPITIIGSKLGIEFLSNTRWLINTNLVLYSIIFVNIWEWFGYNMIIYLAGLQAIPIELYEAADIDGASWFRNLIHITLPLMIPPIAINAIITTIGGLKVFELPYVMTGGGPGYSSETVIMTITRLSFYNSKFGYGASLTVLLFAVVLFIALVQNKLFNRAEKGY